MTEVAPDDRRPPLAQAAAWAARVMTVALEMVLPGVVGIWIDRRLGTQVLFTLLGFAGGLTFAIWQLLKMIKPDPSNAAGKLKSEGDPPETGKGGNAS